MSSDLGLYQPYDPEIVGRVNDLPRSDARRAFDRCMNTKPFRLLTLAHLLLADDVILASDDKSVQALNDWFLAHLEADPDRPGQPLPIWYSIVHDIGLFLGDVIIARNINLRWEFFTWGKSNVAFQRHVIMGFTGEDFKLHTNIDIDRMVNAYAHGVVEKRGSAPEYGTVIVRGVVVDVDAAAARYRDVEIEKDAFVRWVRAADLRRSE